MKISIYSNALFVILSLTAISSLADWRDHFARSKEEWQQERGRELANEGRTRILCNKLQDAIRERNLPLLQEIFTLAEANFIDIVNAKIPIYGGGFGGEFTPIELVSLHDDRNQEIYEFLIAHGARGLPWHEARRAQQEENARQRRLTDNANEEANRRWAERRQQEQQQFRRRTGATFSLVALLAAGLYYLSH